MPLPSTMTPIATTTLGSAAAAITFSSIPSTYTDLVLVCNIASTSSNTLFIRFNGDTGTNYSATRLYGSGTAAGSDRDTNASYGLLTNYAYPTSTLGNTTEIVSIMNYSNSTTYKTFLSRANAAGAGVDAIVGLWRATPAAINSISLSTNGFAGTTTISSGSNVTLYGVKAA